MTSLFDPARIGDIPVANRIAMAPLTRNRAGAGQVPTDLTVEYYRQRASAGLIITEASQIMAEGQGYLDTPGIFSPAQIAGWKRVTDAVHAEGGRIVIQLWHVGCSDTCEMRPTCHSWITMRPPSACTAFVTLFQPAIWAGEKIPGVSR